MRINRQPFDAGARFTAVRPFLLGGVQVKAGDPVSITDARRLRQLYECRMLSMGQPVAAKASQPTKQPQQNNWKKR